MNQIAVDKDILEFEIKLLEKFIITSEAITDWKDFLKDILGDVSRMLRYMCFYVIFREDENSYYTYIFWNFLPKEKEECKRLFVKELTKKLRHTEIYSEGAKIEFEHIELNILQDSEDCSIDSIRILSKELILEKPLVGGAVGLGVNVHDAENEIKKLAIEGLLATILNIVGSIKAINKYTEKLEYYATRDPLTNLYNQRVFWELLGYEVNRAKRHGYKFSLFVVDVDNFKFINDTYGHGFGDEFLIDIAGILREVFRREDIIARYGGDEFAAILPYTGAKEAEAVAKRLMSAFEKFSKLAPDGKRVKATLSIGISIFPDHAEDPKTLFLLADDTMYEVKKEGKNRYKIVNDEHLYDVEKEKAQKSFLVLEALEKKSLVPLFQPILNLKTWEIEAYEVLMGIEKEGQIIRAEDFIDVAESIGVVQGMDYILIEKALEEVNREKCEPMLFFNLSPKTMVLSEFMTQIKKLIDKFGYRHDKVVFELTERETVSNIGALKRFLENLKLEGFKFAIDDFGSGFASFTYLKLLPVDIVKIEGDFVRSVLESKIDRTFVESAVYMAKALNISTVAEYVEDEEILKAIKDIGIDFAQGYFVGRPSREMCTEPPKLRI